MFVRWPDWPTAMGKDALLVKSKFPWMPLTMLPKRPRCLSLGVVAGFRRTCPKSKSYVSATSDQGAIWASKNVVRVFLSSRILLMLYDLSANPLVGDIFQIFSMFLTCMVVFHHLDRTHHDLLLTRISSLLLRWWNSKFSTHDWMRILTWRSKTLFHHHPCSLHFS